MKVRWVYSDADGHAHVLDQDGPAGSETVLTRCRQVLPETAGVYQTVPSMNICARCGVYAAVPPPEHGTSDVVGDPGRSPDVFGDPGRSLVEPEALFLIGASFQLPAIGQPHTSTRMGGHVGSLQESQHGQAHQK